jgi:O-antigen ligase
MIVASTPSSLHFSLNPGEDYRAAASWGIQMGKNSNHLAFFSIVGIIILWYKNQEVSSHLLRCASFGIIGLLLLVVFLCASRNAMLNLVVLGVILTVDAGIQPKKIFATALIIICLTTAMVFVVPEQNLKRMTAFQMDASQPEAASSSRDRFLTLKTGLQMFSDHNPLIGVGPGNFRWIRQLYYDHKQLATHNSYLWALVSGGVPLLLAFLGLFRAILKNLRRLEASPNTESGPPQWMVKTIRTSLLVFFFFSFFTEAFLGLFPFLFAALAVVMMRMQQEESTAIS